LVVFALQVTDFIHISDNTYSRQQILGMEKSILNKMSWNLTVPTMYVFLARFAKAAGAGSDKELEHMVFFFSELALMEYGMVSLCPSLVAASAVYAARCTLNKSPIWTETLKHHTGFNELQLM
jgi:cyclin B